MLINDLLLILKSIVCIPFIFFIPGFLVNSILFLHKPIKLDSFLLLHIYVSIIITSFISLILAQLGLFSLFNLLILLILISFLLYLKFKKLELKVEFNPVIVFNQENFFLILLILLSIILFFQPYQWIAGGRDPGVYVSAGVHIAKTGSIIIKDPLIAQMNTSIQEALYDVEPASVYGFISWGNMNSKFQFPGFYITDLGSGTIIPQFLHLFPVWIAIFYSIFGLAGAFYVNPVFGVLSIISLYLLGKRLFTWKVGVLVGFILTLNFAQIWYARYPFSEIMAQFFFLSGVAVFIQLDRMNSKYLSVVSVLLFGLAFLTKIEELLLLAPIGIYFMYMYLYKKLKTHHYYFLASIIILLIIISIDYMLFSKPYITQILKNIMSSPSIHYSPIIPIYERLPTTINMISWYETLTAIVLAIIGIVALLRKEKNEKLFLSLIGLLYCLIFLSKPMISSDHPWWIRRFVPVIFPLFAIFAGYTLNEIARIKRIGLFLSSALIIYLIISLVAASYPIISHSEGEGMVQGVGNLSEIFKSNDIIIMDPSFESAIMSTPLYYIFDKKVINLFRVNPYPGLRYRELQSPEEVSMGIDYLLNKDYNVYIVSNANNVYVENLLYHLGTGHKIDFIGTNKFSYLHLESTLDKLPREKTNVPIISNIYRVSKTDSNVVKDGNISINIGSPLDVLYLKTGYHSAEQSDGITFRWTSGNASIQIPTQINRNISLSITAGSFLPDGVQISNVTIYLNEHLIENFTPSSEYKTYIINLNENLITHPNSSIRIISRTWKPSEYIGNTDSRELGIRIDKINISIR